MNIISSKYRHDSLNIREISQEATSLGYTTRTVVKLHSTLIEILMNATDRSGGEPAFQLSLKFTTDKIIIDITALKSVFAYFITPFIPPHEFTQILKTEDFIIFISKKDDCNILKIKLNAEQKQRLDKEYRSSWEVRRGQAKRTIDFTCQDKVEIESAKGFVP